ncbi:hypothetical protein J7K97_02355 [Candidatus Aerophobetes bacterium]|nr:hypothetical protein [Candidatus Aerophobetes bacterium]
MTINQGFLRYPEEVDIVLIKKLIAEQKSQGKVQENSAKSSSTSQREDKKLINMLFYQHR